MMLPPAYDEEDGLEPIGKFVPRIIKRLEAQFFEGSNSPIRSESNAAVELSASSESIA